MSRGDIIRISVEGRELEHIPMDYPWGTRGQGGVPRFLGANAPSGTSWSPPSHVHTGSCGAETLRWPSHQVKAWLRS